MKLQKLEAVIRAGYERIAGQELSVVGRYTEWGLKNESVLNKLIKGTGYQDCKKFLVDNKYRIITAIGLVYFDIRYQQNSLDQLTAEIQAAVSKEGIGADISVTFKREVSQRLSTTTKNYYQIFLWRTAAPPDLDLFSLDSK